MTHPTALIDFQADWKATLQHGLTEMGYPTDPSDDFRIVSTKYFNARHRRIIRQPRQILKAAQFACLPEFATALANLEAAIQGGADLMPYQSTGLLRPNFDDYLLNDWDIHHFHLGTGPHKTIPGFVARSGPVLFTRLTSDIAYFIAILDHGSWAEPQLIEIIHQNWPSSIQAHRIIEAREAEAPLGENGIKRLRKEKIGSLAMIEPGIVYQPLGGGYTLVGTSLSVAMNVTKSVGVLRKLEKWTRNNIPLFLDQVLQLGLTPADRLIFKLKVDKNAVRICEIGSGVEQPINAPILRGWLA